ncbi:MAG: septation protein SepH [Actinomycetaceae bacterium]|nr:septation protein SepH [Arcanobacterium sp.]MDD7686573.1 septation protein SepH [Actinomycetaceae bacterium]MDY5272853.1 septation protein SepH [Arcanobacterium sp.]
MIELELLGVEPNGERLNLNDGQGNRYSLAITDQLRAALRQDLPHPPAEAKPMTPREIQALFRAGKSVDDVAQLSSLPATQLLALERPITAERLYTAKQARSYRQAHELGGLTIEELVVSRLLDRGVAAEGIAWDAYRDAGEPWNLTATYTINDLQHTALWRINTKAQAVTALNDEAAWLTETQVPAPASPWRAHNTPKIDPQNLPAYAEPEPPASISHIGDSRMASAPDASFSTASDVPTIPPFSPAQSTSAATPEEGDAADIDIDSVLASLDSQRGKSRPMPDDDESDNETAGSTASGSGRAASLPATANIDADENTEPPEGATVLAFPQQQRLPVADDPADGDSAATAASGRAATPADDNAPALLSVAPDAQQNAKRTTGSKQKKRRDRPTMPSWDEIVFGYAKKDDSDD